MRITITAHRLREQVSDYTVLVCTRGSGNVDVSLWLNDEQARKLGAELLAAAEPAAPAPATPTTTPEAAA